MTKELFAVIGVAILVAILYFWPYILPDRRVKDDKEDDSDIHLGI